AWPRMAGSTQPMITSLTSAGATPDSSSAARMAVAPSFGVGTPVNWPRNEPIAVRLEPTMTMLGSDMEILRLRTRRRPGTGFIGFSLCDDDNAGGARGSGRPPQRAGHGERRYGMKGIESSRIVSRGREGGLHPRNLLLMSAIALALGGCGGGGNVKPTPVTPAQPPPPTTPTDQPPLDAQLAITNTYPAHTQGFVGTGVTIGIVDSGIMRSNPTVTGR